MHEDKIKTIKIVLIAAVVIIILAAFTYLIYGFGLFWATFAVGITIALLVIVIAVLLAIIIYLLIKMFLLKREIKRYEIRFENLKMELSRCRFKLRQLIDNTRED